VVYDEFVERAKSPVPPGSHIWVVQMAFFQLNTSHMTNLKRHANLQKKVLILTSSEKWGKVTPF
jgi:hypothetical protein